MTIPILYHIDPLSFRPRPGYGCVYKYNVLGKDYVGQTRQNLKARHRSHIAYYPSLRELNVKLPVDHKLRNNPYTLNILWTGEIGQLNAIESEYISKLDSIAPNGWNYTLGGDAPAVINESTRQKLRESRLGRKCSEETKQKLRAYNLANPSRGTLGKPMSDATKEKLRQANLGKKHTDESKMKISMSLTGRKRSADEIKNMSIAQQKRYSDLGARLVAIRNLESAWAHNRGRKLTIEHKMKQSESLKKNTSRRFKDTQFQKKIVLKLDIADNVICVFTSARSVDMSIGTWHRVQTKYHGFYHGYRYCYADEHSI